jgi:membrane associated rhomboid family serine protease
MFNNIPAVTKNLLLINIALYLVSMVLLNSEIDLFNLFSGRYFNSVFFEPYQIVTHMFMHSQSDFFHLLFNMFALFMFGSHLERLWGGKRFFIFYIASGLGAFILYNSIGVWQIMDLRQQLVGMGYDMAEIKVRLLEGQEYKIKVFSEELPTMQAYVNFNGSRLVGASGAIFGLLAGFGILFPNTELRLLFPPIPVKAKYLIGAYLAFEIYNSIYNSGDSIAHLAHVGGAVVGAILVLYWRKTDRNNFYQ